MSGFIILSVLEEDESVKETIWIKKLFYKTYKKRLLKQQPVLEKSISYLGEEGMQLILPFKKEEMEQLGDEYILEFLQKIMYRYDISNPYYMEPLRRFNPNPEYDNGRAVKYLFVRKILEYVQKQESLSSERIEMAIVDSGDRKVEYILELFYEQLNRLTIITEREEYFRGFKEMVYENTGLAAETVPFSGKEKIDGNLIMDLNKDSMKIYSRFQEKAFILDFESTIEKRQYLFQRRRDLDIIYDIELAAGKEMVNNELFGNILCHKSWLLDGFIKYGKKFCSAMELIELERQYPVKVQGLKKLQQNSGRVQ